MEIKTLLETVYLPDWSTHAYICKDGTVYVEIMPGRRFTKDEFIEHEKDNGHNKEFMETRMKLFDDLQDYYNEIKP